MFGRISFFLFSFSFSRPRCFVLVLRLAISIDIYILYYGCCFVQCKKATIEKNGLLCSGRSWVGNDVVAAGGGVNGWVRGLCNVSGRVGFILLRIFAVAIIVWISWTKSGFVNDGNASWRTVKRMLMISMLVIGL